MAARRYFAKECAGRQVTCYTAWGKQADHSLRFYQPVSTLNKQTVEIDVSPPKQRIVPTIFGLFSGNLERISCPFVCFQILVMQGVFSPFKAGNHLLAVGSSLRLGNLRPARSKPLDLL